MVWSNLTLDPINFGKPLVWKDLMLKPNPGDISKLIRKFFSHIYNPHILSCHLSYQLAANLGILHYRIRQYFIIIVLFLIFVLDSFQTHSNWCYILYSLLDLYALFQFCFICLFYIFIQSVLGTFLYALNWFSQAVGLTSCPEFTKVFYTILD